MLGCRLGRLFRVIHQGQKKELKKLFTTKRKNTKANIAKDTNKSPKRTLKVCPMNIYGHVARCLLDTGAVSSLICASLVKELGQMVELTKRTITDADGSISKC